MPVRVVGLVLVLRRIGLVLLTLALAACGETAAPVNVEGTVQARVSATVGAAQRAQATATRGPLATTVIALGTPGTPGTPGATATAGAAGTGTPNPSGTVIGTGTPLRTSTPGGTTTVSGTGTAGTALTGTVTPLASPAGTAAPTLALGTFARFGSFSATIVRYEWNTACPDGAGAAPAGSKYVRLQAVGRNDGGGTLMPPPLIWAVESTPAGSSQGCRPAGQSFDEACYRSGAVAAGARCEGWLLFEVPAALDVPGSLVTARTAGPQPPASSATQDIGRWRLPG